MKKDMLAVSHLMPCSVVLLSAGNGTKKDAMTATSMFVSEDPPLFVVSVDRGHLTHALIEETGQFVLNVASVGQVKLARGLGSTHGCCLHRVQSNYILPGRHLHSLSRRRRGFHCKQSLDSSRLAFQPLLQREG